LNIPGTPSAIPTQIAGFPLTASGQGAKAIGTALTFSMIGNWAGLVVLVLLVPVMLSITLHFSSWEMFLLVLIGISISGSLAGRERPLKGWIMGCLGLLLAMAGKDSIHGVERFTFDIVQLNAGIGYLPVMIGLFGLSEVFRVLKQPHPPRPPAAGSWVVLPDFGDLRRYWRSAARSSAIGAIPGAGANIASYVSFMAGERATGRRFSDGDLEGVVCSEVANNANIGGGLLPTTTLGIPGNNSSALLIAALALHGVARPGSDRTRQSIRRLVHFGERI
jgi:putative tricarboxylic transport membrane protein